MEISDQSHSHKLSHSSHGFGCKLRGLSPRRRRKRSGGGRGKLKWGRSDLASPVAEWKFNGFGGGSAPVEGGGGDRAVVVGRSARKLAAEMWRSLAVVRNCGGGVTWHGQHDPLLFGLDSHLGNAKTSKEVSTKWDDHHCHNNNPIEVWQFHGYAKLLRSEQVAYASQIKLARARNRVKELETERHLFKKKLKHFLRGLGGEMASSIRRESKKMHLIVDELEGELEREKRSCQKMRNFNSKLMSDLAETKLSTAKIMEELEKEKRGREFLENVCHELGNDIQEHKANIRAMKIEFGRIQEEVEEERRMMQLAEVWREERVQMKLVDAKVTLEEKYSQMNGLIADLETLLTSNNASPMQDINLQENGTNAIESLKNLLNVHSDIDSVHDDCPSVFKDGNENENENPKKVKNRGTSLRKLWKSSPTAADIMKKLPMAENFRPAETGSDQEVFNHNELVSHWCLPGQRTPHIARAMRGCIEWPKGIHRNGFLKADVFEG